MKLNVKHIKLASLCLGTLSLGAATLFAVPGMFHRWGTDILHVFSYQAMTNEGVRTNAVGFVSLSQRQQGKVDVQTLGITVRGLETNVSYSLFALVNNDTNLTPVADIKTDALGRVRLNYRQVEHSNGHMNPVGRGWQPLPASLDPVSLVRELVIATVSDTATQAVLTADLTTPNRLQYLVKRDMSSNNVPALLQINANTNKTLFRLTAWNLSPTNDYLLTLNGGVVQTNTTDALGRLVIREFLENSVDVLKLQSVELWDSASNSVLTTTLPWDLAQ